MSRRRLTEKQRRAIRDRKAKSEKSNTSTEVDRHICLARVIARYGKTADIQDEQGNIYRANIRATLQGERAVEDVVVGDWVSFQPSAQADRAIILKRQLPRTQLLRAVRHFQGKAVASNIDQLVIVWSPSPPMTTFAIESYWVAAVSNGLTPILLLNKVDLFEGELDEHMNQVLLQKSEFTRIYHALGLTLLEVSVKSGMGVAALKGLLSGKVSVIMGVSGVGKSSLANLLLGEQVMETGNLSKSLASGTHTTTTARFLNLPWSGAIIDAPGIREFQLLSVEESDLLKAYPDVEEYAHQCKFNDCRHNSEPGCAVGKALNNGSIQPWRYQNYVKMREQLCSL